MLMSCQVYDYVEWVSSAACRVVPGMAAHAPVPGYGRQLPPPLAGTIVLHLTL